MKRNAPQVILQGADGVRWETKKGLTNIQLKCPNCREWRDLSQFGLRKMKPTKDAPGRNQSWCTPCRSIKK